MNENKDTNLDRLRAVTEHMRCYPDLAQWVSQVGIMRHAEVNLFASGNPEKLNSFAQWAVSVEATDVKVRGHEDQFILEAAGHLAGGTRVAVFAVFPDPSPLKADRIEPDTTVPLEQIVTLTAVAS